MISRKNNENSLPKWSATPVCGKHTNNALKFKGNGKSLNIILVFVAKKKLLPHLQLQYRHENLLKHLKNDDCLWASAK